MVIGTDIVTICRSTEPWVKSFMVSSMVDAKKFAQA